MLRRRYTKIVSRKGKQKVGKNSVTAFQALASQNGQLLVTETHDVGTLTVDTNIITVETAVVYPFNNPSKKAGVLRVKGSHIEDAQLHMDEIEETLQVLADVVALLKKWDAEPSNADHRTRLHFSTPSFSFSIHCPSAADMERLEVADREYRERRRTELQHRIEQGDTNTQRLLNELDEGIPNRRRAYFTGSGTLASLPVEQLPEFKKLLNAAMIFSSQTEFR